MPDETTTVTDETENPDKAVADEAAEPAPASSTPKLISSFVKLSGYKRADVLAYSEERRTVVTKNGSKYLVSKSGKQLKVLLGALPPSAEEDESEE